VNSFRQHKEKLDQLAAGHWPDILAQLDVPAHVITKRKAQPCPRCGGRDRYEFTDKYDRGDAFCRGCGHLDAFAIADACGVSFMQIIDHLETRFGVTRSRDAVAPAQLPTPYFERIWREAQALNEGDAATRYLRNRGLRLQTLPSSLRLHSHLEYKGEEAGEGEVNADARYPALVGLIRDHESKPIGIQRIYLDGLGGKANVGQPKKGLGKVNMGGAVRLRVHNGHLGIAEGIETAEACYELYGIPTWSCVTAGNVEKFVIPSGVKRLTIFGDSDRSFTGQKAAFALAHRYYDKVEVNLEWPDANPSAPFGDVDFLDILERTKHRNTH